MCSAKELLADQKHEFREKKEMQEETQLSFFVWSENNTVTLLVILSLPSGFFVISKKQMKTLTRCQQQPFFSHSLYTCDMSASCTVKTGTSVSDLLTVLSEDIHATHLHYTCSLTPQ
jgi:hypothetical protein